MTICICYVLVVSRHDVDTIVNLQKLSQIRFVVHQLSDLSQDVKE
jgi:hypothetical protein